MLIGSLNAVRQDCNPPGTSLARFCHFLLFLPPLPARFPYILGAWRPALPYFGTFRAAIIVGDGGVPSSETSRPRVSQLPQFFAVFSLSGLSSFLVRGHLPL
jgi:hypothetical protein